MTDNNLIAETTARIGEHTATVRLLDTGDVKMTPRMAAQLDSVSLDELDAFGRVRVYRYKLRTLGSGGYGFEDVVIGRDPRGDLAIANIPKVPFRPTLSSARGAHRPRIGSKPDPYGIGEPVPRRVVFEGRLCEFYAHTGEKVTDGSLAVDELDPNGNEETFREQIAEHDRGVALCEELLKLPRILLRED